MVLVIKMYTAPVRCLFLDTNNILNLYFMQMDNKIKIKVTIKQL